MIRHGAWEDERGFTLIEVMVTIVIMGIVFAIASSFWFKMAESRRVDSATNQVVADLRLAHTQATNRLTDYSFVAPADPVPAWVVDLDPDPDPLSTYQVGPPAVPEDIDTMILPGDDRGTPKTKILAATTIVFKPTGEAKTLAGAPPEDITVAASDGDPSHTININTVTSRVKIVN